MGNEKGGWETKADFFLHAFGPFPAGTGRQVAPDENNDPFIASFAPECPPGQCFKVSTEQITAPDL